MVVDAHSKWIEAVPVPSTSSIVTITVLRNLFATHGIPELIFFDNGTSFTSDEFKEFVKRNEPVTVHQHRTILRRMDWQNVLYKL